MLCANYAPFEPSPAIYNALKEAEGQVKAIHSEIDLVRAEESTPTATALNSLRVTLLARASDPAARPELRRALATIIERITCDPKAGIVNDWKRGPSRGWKYTVTLRGSNERACLEVARSGRWCVARQSLAKAA